MQEQVTHVRCPACRSTVKAFDTHCWVCGTELASAAPRDNVVIDASTQAVAPAHEHGFDAMARRIAQFAPPGAGSASHALIPAGPLRTVNERTYFRRPPGAPRQITGGQLLLPSPVARIAQLAPPPAPARRNSAVQPLMAVAAMVFMSVAAMTFVGRFAAQPAAAVRADKAAPTASTALPPTTTEVSSLAAIVTPPASNTTAPPTPAATPTAPVATPTRRPIETATRAPTPSATTQATSIASPTSANAASTQAPDSPTTYQVKRGDTCSEIARAFNISLARLAEFNRLDARCWLRAGQTLTIPAVQR